MDNFFNILMMLMPLLILQFGLMIFCIVKILKEGVANLNKGIWILIVIFANLLGPIMFLLVGRRRDI